MSQNLLDFDLLKRIVHLSYAPLPLEQKLDQMLQSVSASLQTEQCAVLRSEDFARNGFLDRVASGRKALWVEDGFSFPRDEIPEEEKSLIRPAFVCLPIFDETSCEGILYLGFSEKRIFSPAEVETLSLVAGQTLVALRQASLQHCTEQTRFELTALRELGNVLTSTLKLEDLLPLILETGARVLKAKGGVLRLNDPTTGLSKVQCSLGYYEKIPLGEKIAKRVLSTKTPVAFTPIAKNAPFRSLLCTPLIAHGKSYGTLAYFDLEVPPSRFDEGIAQLLMTLVNQVSSSIENVLNHREISDLARREEGRVKRLSVLWELNKALLTTVNFDRIIQLTLTAVTIGEGLGFNRAMLFLVNEKTSTLEGIMAVGPDNAEEAGRVWDYVSQKKEPLSDLILELPNPAQEGSLLNATARGICVPLKEGGCVLSRTVLEERPFNVQVPSAESAEVQNACVRGCQLGSEVGCYVGEHLGRNPNVYAFATVPLWGKGKVIGLILVDNLYNQSPIREEDVQYLSMFANQAGLAIENARLYRNLQEVHQELKETQALLVQREKMAALGEMANTVAHEIKNPLVSIGGFARRLYRTSTSEDPEKRYTQAIMIEVARLEQTLNDILYYTREDPEVSTPCDLREILEGSLSMISEGSYDQGIQVIRQFSGELPKIRADGRQLKQAFFNLITNACQAMHGQGTLTVRAYPSTRNGSSGIRVEVEDTGTGIAPESIHNIFNPFYSTKETGMGLGLPMVDKIIASHGGHIEVDNRPGRGTTFIVTLPVRDAMEQGPRDVPREGEPGGG